MKTRPDEKAFIELFRKDGAIPASTQARLEDTYEEIRRSCRKKEAIPMRKQNRRRLTIALAAAAIALLTCSALAVGLTHTDFIKSVFGAGIAGRDAVTVEQPSGSPYTLPASQRADVDTQRAEALLGDEIADSGTSFTAAGYTFTIDSYVMDANGIACMTYTLENPSGLGILYDAGGGEVCYHDPNAVKGDGTLLEPMFATASGATLDSRTYLDTANATDTKATLVVYLTPMAALAADDGIVMTVSGYAARDDGTEAVETLKTVTLPASAKVPCVELTGTGVTVAVSPVGMTVTSESFRAGDCQIDELSLRYADGSTYVVESENPYILNASVSAESGQTVWLAFNRLVDVDQLSAVVVDGTELAR